MTPSWKTIAASLLVASAAWAQTPSAEINNATRNVSINVEDTDMLTVLKLIAEQSGRNVVIGPDVATTKLNLDLKDVSLNDALDVILKPHGYGYRTVGTITVVDKLDNLKLVASVEPLQSRVFKLSYLDAADVIDSIEGLLSERGSCKALYVAKKQGWNFSQDTEGSAAKLDRVTQSGSNARTASKTLIISDIPTKLTQIENTIKEIDVMPAQVEIRAYFVEMKSGALKDIGFDWQMNLHGSGWNTAQLDSAGAIVQQAAGTIMGQASPYGYPSSDDTSVSATESYNAGMAFGVVNSGSNMDIDMMLRAVEENGDINILSAPRIMAQDNQEAAIVVGKKVPIITTDSGDESGSISTQLDYYERIGIQLNVVPQLCDNGMISMIVHPSVSEQDGFSSASLASAVDTALTKYPIIKTREAETRLTVRDGQTIAIGGLISDRLVKSELKVPLLGDIPFLGRLFRRDTESNNKIELMILLSASVYTDSNALPQDLNTRVEQSANKLMAQWKADRVDISSDDSMIEPMATELSE